MTEAEDRVADGRLADIIDRAANKIVDLGWTQSKLWNDDPDGRDQRYYGGPVCAVGALILAAGGVETVDENRRDVMLAREAVELVLASEYDIDELAEWNDEHGRTQEEVVGIMRTTAQSLRG